MKTKIELKDFTDFKFLSNISHSPNGKLAAFVAHDVDFDDNQYCSNLYLLNVASGDVKKLTQTGSEKSFSWENDDTILFASARTKVEPGHTVFYRINVNGGEAQKAFDIPQKVSRIESLGGEHFMLCVNKKIDDKKAEPNHSEEGKDYYVFEELPHWFNGQGVINRTRRVLMSYDAKTGDTKQFTNEYMHADGAVLSDCRKVVAYMGNEFTDVMGGAASLNTYNFETGATTVLVPQTDESLGNAIWIGEDIFFTACKKNELNIWHNPTFYTINGKTKERREIGFFDFGIGGGIGTDCTYGGGSSMCVDGGKLYFLHANRVNSELCVLENDKFRVLSRTPGAINSMSVKNGNALIMAMRGTYLTELYEMDLKTGDEKKLTGFNDNFHDTKTIAPIEYTTFKTPYGVDLDCFVLKPIGYKEGEKYPAVLSMHGGPKAIFGGVYHHEMQAMANMGYFVYYTNPRGSDGRGDDFANALIHKMGGPDYDDFMALTDHVLATFPDIDEKKVGICGGSYAGFMINWMIGHTDRFAAGASQRSIANYMSKGLSTDIGYSHNMTQIGSTPWESFDRMWDQSPLKYAYNAKTPTLFIQSNEDYRCWMSEPIQMFNVLRRNNVPTKICLFKGENHELSRSGKPQNRLSRLEEITAWFAKYLA